MSYLQAYKQVGVGQEITTFASIHSAKGLNASFSAKDNTRDVFPTQRMPFSQCVEWNVNFLPSCILSAISTQDVHITSLCVHKLVRSGYITYFVANYCC